MGCKWWFSPASYFESTLKQWLSNELLTGIWSIVLAISASICKTFSWNVLFLGLAGMIFVLWARPFWTRWLKSHLTRKHHSKGTFFIHFCSCLVQDRVCFFVCFYIMFKVGLSPSRQNYFYLLQWKHFKNKEKWFLFHL